MRLKILMMPLAILISLVIVIGFVKPQIEVFQEKRVQLDTKKTQAQGMTTLLENINTLTASLEAQSEFERLMGRYLPKDLDQERIVDMFNYLASQSGVLVSDMAMKEVVLKSDASDSDMPLDPSVPVIVSSRPKVKAYVGSIEVKGDYTGIKTFLDKVNHMNRFHKILNFSIATPSSTAEEETPGLLVAKLESQFEYFPAQQYDSALSLSVFSKKELGGDDWVAFQDWVTNTVPPMTGSDSGRANPFQP